MTALLEAHGITRKFGAFTAVNNVSLAIEAGPLTAIIGPNGAGKTTLINVLTGHLMPTAGKVTFNGQDITHWPPDRRVRAGLNRSFQITNIFLQLTVAENVAVPVLVRRGYPAVWYRDYRNLPEIRGEVDRLLDEVGLADLGDTKAAALSHGDRRILDMTLALATHPRLCFLDEPTAGMNAGERLKLLDFIKRLRAAEDVTFVLVEHDMDVVFSVADRVIVLDKGQVLADGDPETIRRNRLVQEVYLGEEVGA